MIDEIVEEIRAIRAAHAAKYDYDLAKICAALREQERNSTAEVVLRGPRLIDEVSKAA
jgi:hypothetical protein